MGYRRGALWNFLIRSAGNGLGPVVHWELEKPRASQLSGSGSLNSLVSWWWYMMSWNFVSIGSGNGLLSVVMHQAQAQAKILLNEFENYTFRIIATFPKGPLGFTIVWNLWCPSELEDFGFRSRFLGPYRISNYIPQNTEGYNYFMHALDTCLWYQSGKSSFHRQNYLSLVLRLFLSGTSFTNLG